VFAVSKKGDLTVLAEAPPDAQRAAVDLAVRYCPTHALSVQEDPTA
jgi:ferredoxin